MVVLLSVQTQQDKALPGSLYDWHDGAFNTPILTECSIQE